MYFLSHKNCWGVSKFSVRKCGSERKSLGTTALWSEISKFHLSKDNRGHFKRGNKNIKIHQDDIYLGESNEFHFKQNTTNY